MSRKFVWLTLSLTGFAYWGVVHRFASSGVHHFAGPVWFGGMALALHWFTNRTPGVSEVDRQTLPPSTTDGKGRA